ncbi:MAG: hypothetical protein WKF97_06235 [Chitinophagaceae bacterium]
MKSIIILAFIILISLVVKAQKKALIQQIVALQVHIGYLQKGYSIAKKGLNLISDIKNGELNLHTDYFNSLKTVNPRIRNYSKVGDCIIIQVKILNEYKKAYGQLQESKAFNTDELSYMSKVFKRLLDDCTGPIDELIAITTSNKLEMKDDERLKRIDALYSDIQAKYSFVKSYANEVKILAVLRLREHNDVQMSHTINGIKN